MAGDIRRLYTHGTNGQNTSLDHGHRAGVTRTDRRRAHCHDFGRQKYRTTTDYTKPRPREMRGRGWDDGEQTGMLVWWGLAGRHLCHHHHYYPLCHFTSPHSRSSCQESYLMTLLVAMKWLASPCQKGRTHRFLEERHFSRSSLFFCKFSSSSPLLLLLLLFLLLLAAGLPFYTSL